MERNYEAIDLNCSNAGQDFCHSDDGITRAGPKRQWCYICLIITATISAILVPLILFVFVPAIAQGMINSAEFTFLSAEISSPTNETFELYAAIEIGDIGPFSATAYFLGPVELCWKGGVIGSVVLPPLEIKSGGARLSLNGVVNVFDENRFAESIQEIVRSEYFEWQMKGQIQALAFGIKIDGLLLDKSIKLRGLNGLKEIVVGSFNLPSNDPVKGITLDISASVINPSPVSMALGDVIFDVFFSQSHIGEVMVPNLQIHPGNNSLNMGGRLLPITNQNDQSRLNILFSNFVAGHESQIDVVGVSVNSSDPVSWLNKAIRGLQISTIFKSSGNYKFLTSLQMSKVNLEFFNHSPYSPKLSAPDVVAGFSTPFGDFPLSINSIKQHVDLMTHTRIATIDSKWTKARGSSDFGRVFTGLHDETLVVEQGKESEWDDFCSRVAHGSGKVMINMKGYADVKAEASIGPFMIEHVAFQDEIPFEGLNGLKDADIQLKWLKIQEGRPDAMSIRARISMQNPSNVDVMLHGYTQFDLHYEGAYIGYAKTTNLHLVRGYNEIECEAVFQPTDKGRKGTKSAQLASKFAMQDPAIPIDVSGTKVSSDIVSLNAALSKIRLQTNIPGMKKSLLMSAYFTFSIFEALTTRKAHAKFEVFNDFDAAIQIDKIYVEFYYKNSFLGFVNEDLTGSPILLPPKTATMSKSVTAQFKIKTASIKAFLEVMAGPNGGILVFAKCDLDVRIGGFSIFIHYEQDGIFVRLGNKV